MKDLFDNRITRSWNGEVLYLGKECHILSLVIYFSENILQS